MPAPRPTAYSYVRFSTPEQAQGDSFRRQLALSSSYAAANGLELDQSLTFRDAGISAFRGKNAAEGALRRFIEMAEAGRIARGSYLLVESLDRLSRDRISEALHLLTSIVRLGVVVVTLADGRRYTEESLDDFTSLIVSISLMSRAHEESQIKSRRIGAAWQAKRVKAAETGAPLTAKAPAWVRLDPDTRSYQLIAERAEVLRKIFGLTVAGYGKQAVARWLNAKGIPAFGDGPNGSRQADGWHPSYIQKILDSPSVLGTYQPHRIVRDDETDKRRRVPDGPPIENYFPPAIDAELYHRAVHARRSRPGTRGPKGETFSNLLSGLPLCGLCGRPMHFVNKGHGKHGGRYLHCSASRRLRGECRAAAVRYDVVLPVILNSLASEGLDVAGLLGSSGADAISRRRKEIVEQTEAIEGRIADATGRIDRLVESLERTQSSAVEQRLIQLEAETAADRDALDRLREELRDLEARAKEAEHSVKDVRALVAEWNASVSAIEANPSELYAFNVRFNGALRTLVDHVGVAVSDSARTYFETELFPFLQRQLGDVDMAVETCMSALNGVRRGVSIRVGFRDAPNHCLAVYTDARDPHRYVSAGLSFDTEGRLIEATLSAPVSGQ